MHTDFQITIDVVKGGFLLSYPDNQALTKFGMPGHTYEREVFTSPRKMHQKLKEVIESLSTVADDSKAGE